MNKSTEEMIRNMVVSLLKTVRYYENRRKRLQGEIESIDEQIAAEQQRIDVFLNTLAMNYSDFNAEAYLNRLIAEWLV